MCHPIFLAQPGFLLFCHFVLYDGLLHALCKPIHILHGGRGLGGEIRSTGKYVRLEYFGIALFVKMGVPRCLGGCRICF